MIKKPVVVEGPDGSGKTTLINRLIQDEGLALAPKFSHSTEGPHQDHVGAAVQDMVNPLEGFIYDRHPAISEPIYGTVIRRLDDYVEMNPYVGDWLNQVHLIICLPEFSVTAELMKADDQLPGVAENFPLIYGLYEYFAATQSPRAFRYDFTQDDSYENLRRALNA